jgi:hypothetical protein
LVHGLDANQKPLWQNFIKLEEDSTIVWGSNYRRTAGNWRYNYTSDGTGFFLLEFSAKDWKPKRNIYNDQSLWDRNSINHWHSESYEEFVIMKKVTVNF